MSWYTVKTQGVVLKSLPFREVDRRYSILTRDYGKVEVIGRGAQKELAKLAPSLEPFGVLDLEIVRGKIWTTVISAEKIEKFWVIDKDINIRLFAQTLLHLLDRYMIEAERDKKLYEVFLSWLRYLNEVEFLHPTRATFLMGGFLLRVLKHFGYAISLEKCVSCNCKITPLSFRWHGGKGGLICSDCVRSDDREWFAARSIDEKVITLLRFATDASIDEFSNLSLSGALVGEFASIVHDLLLFHLPGANDKPFWEGFLMDEQIVIGEKTEIC